MRTSAGIILIPKFIPANSLFSRRLIPTPSRLGKAAMSLLMFRRKRRRRSRKEEIRCAGPIQCGLYTRPCHSKGLLADNALLCFFLLMCSAVITSGQGCRGSDCICASGAPQVRREGSVFPPGLSQASESCSILNPTLEGFKESAEEETLEVIVAVQQGNIIATAFHPELTRDIRWHRFCLSTYVKCKEKA